MNYKECVEKINELMEENLRIKKQSYIMFIPQMEMIERENLSGNLIQAFYDIDNVWDEFCYLENKTLFFIFNFLKKIVQGIQMYEDIINNNSDGWISTNNFIEEATYYFDAFIASFYSIIELDRKEFLKKYFKSEEIEDIFPSRNEVGLYWQVYNLRNRIIHYTSGRYNENKKICMKYEQFLSKNKVIELKDNNIHVKSTLVDLYKCKALQLKVIEVIEAGEGNPFDKLFPNQSAKGHGKKTPYMMHISDDIWFDYIDSGIELLNNIHCFFDKINRLFLNNFLLGDTQVDITMNRRTILNWNGKEIEYSIKEVFE